MADPLGPSESDQSGIQPSEFRVSPFRLAWQHRWLVVLGGLIGCAAGVLYYGRATPIYESSVQVLVVKKAPEALPSNTTGSGGGGETLSTENYLSTHQTLIRSPIIVGVAVQQAKLAELSFAGGGNPTGAISYGLKIAQETNNNKPTNVLNISFRCTNPDDSAAVVAAIAESYQRFLKDRYQNVADETVRLMTEANDILEKQISRKQKEYDDFLTQHPYLWKGPEGLNPIQERIFILEAKQSALLIEEAELNGRLAAIDKALQDGNFTRAELLAMSAVSQTQMSPASSTSSNSSMSPASAMGGGGGGRRGTTAAAQTMEEVLMSLELQEKTLLEDYGPDHPQVRTVHDQLAQLQKRIKRTGKEPEIEGGNQVVPMKTLIQSLKLELVNIREAREALTKLLWEEQRKAKPLRAVEKRDELYRMEILRSQQLFDTVAKRMDEVSLFKNVTGGFEAEIIAPPEIGAKVAPKLVPVLATALLLGIIAGFGLGYLAEITDQSFRTPEEIRRRLGLPVVGHIPLFAVEEPDNLSLADGPQVDPILCTAHRPKSREAEAYRGVRTALFFNRERGHSIIQVTSPDKSDGKSTLITNLAVSIAQAEKRVILLDADFRRPRLHKLFNMNVERGLSTVMTGEAELNDVIMDSPIPGLSILPCGPIPPNPAELLTLPRFKETLAYLRESYDFVLIDTPPLLAVTDPCVVIPLVDGVLLTIRISKNARPHAMRAKEILSTLGARVIGVVVNGVGSDVNGYGYDSYSYGSRYGYYNYYNYNYQDYYSSDDDKGEAKQSAGSKGNSKTQQSVSRQSSRKKSGLFKWLFDR